MSIEIENNFTLPFLTHTSYRKLSLKKRNQCHCPRTCGVHFGGARTSTTDHSSTPETATPSPHSPRQSRPRTPPPTSAGSPADPGRSHSPRTWSHDTHIDWGDRSGPVDHSASEMDCRPLTQPVIIKVTLLIDHYNKNKLANYF